MFSKNARPLRRRESQEKKKEFLPPLSATWKKCRCETGEDLACTCTSRLRSWPTLMVDHPGQIFREKLSTRIIARVFATFKRSPSFFRYFSSFFSTTALLSNGRRDGVPPIFRNFPRLTLRRRAVATRLNVGAKGSRRRGRRSAFPKAVRAVPKRGARVRRPFRATPAVRRLPLPRRIRESTK